MLANERAKLAMRGVRSGAALSDEDVAVLLENVEAQLIDEMVCVRKEIRAEREMEVRSLNTELELAKIDLERQRGESEEFQVAICAQKTELSVENRRLKAALSAANRLLAIYIVADKGGE